MGRTRGFLFKHRVVAILRQVSRHHHGRVDRQEACGVKKPISRLISWTHRLGSRLAKATASKKLDPGRGIAQVEQVPALEKPAPVPKGHLAVYVGQKDGDFQRIVVPVVYFNHPLFCDLLKESEKEYGFDHPGGITIPCRMSEFEQIQTRITTVHCSRKKIR
ncbi:auxin-responsive protein SAUR36-like [Primulina huaijiensis]|uniref:auxin-responsive protein SAUR36-like n=1 Tax=Primulina huaijiensis TaxID=1492673 RepID=UPI003CC710E1